MKRWWALMVGSLIAGTGLAQMTAEQAFQLGNQAASVQATINAGITQEKSIEVLNGYDPSQRPKGADSYGGSILTTLRNAGSQKATDCGGGINDGSLGAAPHCEAVNAMTHQASQPMTSPITVNDPLITKAKSILANPEEITGPLSMSYSDCFEKTVVVPGQSVVETCDEVAQLEDTTCSTAVQIKADPDYLYSCIETIKSQSDSTCTVGRRIEVDVNTRYICDISQNITTHTCRRRAIISYTPATHPSPTEVNFGKLHYDYNGIKDRHESRITDSWVNLVPSAGELRVNMLFQRRCVWTAVENEALEAYIEVFGPDGAKVGELRVKGNCEYEVTVSKSIPISQDGYYNFKRGVIIGYAGKLQGVNEEGGLIIVQAPVWHTDNKSMSVFIGEPEKKQLTWDDTCVGLENKP